MKGLSESEDLPARDDLSSFVRNEGMGRRPFAFAWCGLRRASGDLLCASPMRSFGMDTWKQRTSPGENRGRCAVVVRQLATGKGRRLRRATSARSFCREAEEGLRGRFWCAWRPAAGGLAEEAALA